MADHDGNHRCLIERNVPIALILSSRWQDGAESLGMETTRSLCQRPIPFNSLVVDNIYGIFTFYVKKLSEKVNTILDTIQLFQ